MAISWKREKGAIEAMRVAFAGTPEYGATVLQKLCRGGLAPVVVLTQPDRPRGRKRQLQASPVKRVAEKQGLPILQPQQLRDPMFLDELRNYRPELLLTAAYGRLLPLALLELPAGGCINLHPSLLPRHRGAAPIQRCLQQGDTETGVTTFLMGEGMDSGPVLMQRRLPVRPQDTAGTLHHALAELGGDLLLETALRWSRGQIKPRLQDESRMTLAPPLRRHEEFLGWNSPSWQLERQVRALAPRPGASTWWQGKELKVLEARTGPALYRPNTGPGQVLESDRARGLLVAAGVGTLVLSWVQPAGKKPMTSDQFVRGYGVRPGAFLGRVFGEVAQ